MTGVSEMSSKLVSDEPERLALAHLPTPLQPLSRTGDALGVELYVKRDDLTGSALSGNKVRKLEYLIAEAAAQGADTLITCGGEQSNHCRATAIAGVQHQMRSVLLLRTRDPAAPPPVEGNILLDRLVGAEIVWISHDEYARRGELMAEVAERVRASGGRPYIIPEGGSNALGAWGYLRAARELLDDLKTLPAVPRTSVIYAAGSGGTGAGLILGLAGQTEVRAVGVNVCDDRDYFVRVIGEICADFRGRWPACAPAIENRDIEIVDGYVGRGYALSRREELIELRDLARREGIVLDPVYTGKAYFGLTRELQRDRRRLGERVVFLHTGGIYGLFPKAAELSPLC